MTEEPRKRRAKSAPEPEGSEGEIVSQADMLAALVGANRQTHEAVMKLAEQVGKQAEQVNILSQLILEAKRNAEATSQPAPDNRASVSSWEPVIQAALARILSGGGGSPDTQVNKALDIVTPWLTWYERARLSGAQEMTDVFTRTVRAGIPPENAITAMQGNVQERVQRLTPPQPSEVKK